MHTFDPDGALHRKRTLETRRLFYGVAIGLALASVILLCLIGR